MPLVRINAIGAQIALAQGAGPVGAALSEALRDVPPEAPVVVMIHGFRFSPARAGKCPHGHILSLAPQSDSWKAVSWPRHLGFTGQHPSEGLCIGFGWEAAGTIWTAYGEAARAGRALARLVGEIRAARPGQQVDVVAHSLGARVTLAALPHLPAGALRRAVLMAPAEMRSRAEAALDTPAGRAARFLNVTSRENDLFDFLLEGLVAPHRVGDRALGHGSGQGRCNWLDLQIDHAGTLAALGRLGHRIAPPARRVCHWSPYLRPGMFPLYRRFLRGEIAPETLRTALPAAQSPRWSRLLARPRGALPLPFAGKAPS